METKVSLYNSHDEKIGETFIRRAKQLVKRQRAVWVDDSRTAIRFAPGMENMDEIAADYEAAPATAAVPISEPAAAVVPISAPAPAAAKPHEPTTGTASDDRPAAWMLPLVEKQMRQRRRFIVHTFAFIPVLTLLHYLFGMFYMGPSVAWIVLYLMHGYLHLTNKFARRRIVKRLAMEAALIKGAQGKS